MVSGRRLRMEKRLRDGLSPSHIEILDESHQHSGRGSETHFRLMVVSEKFVGLSRVRRQQLVYGLIDDEFKAGMHALAMRTFTAAEWSAEGERDNSQSPVCLGGSKSTASNPRQSS